MAHWLNKKTVALIVFVFITSLLTAQEVDKENEKDYKNPKQHEKFYKRRIVISAWQINQLKKGALVVRLKTNQLLIDALKNKGDARLAEEKRLEMQAVNLNITRAYLNYYNFSKVYFMYSNFSDSLLKGTRSAIFLDSNLAIDPSIKMNEDFYLIAETDNLYNSSIGYVKEDSARFQIEKGNPTMNEVSVVVKNKYGHQLKKPFPYASSGGVGLKYDAFVYITINGISIPLNIGEANSSGGSNKVSYLYEGKPMTLMLPRAYTYKKFSSAIENFNESLKQYYQANPSPERNKNFNDTKPFLY